MTRGFPRDAPREVLPWIDSWHDRTGANREIPVVVLDRDADRACALNVLRSLLASLSGSARAIRALYSLTHAGSYKGVREVHKVPRSRVRDSARLLPHLIRAQ